MSEMIERVALAISGSDDPANILVIHRTRARLAIEAMREPTEEMLKACNSIMGGGFQNSHSDLETWETMIDEALR